MADAGVSLDYELRSRSKMSGRQKNGERAKRKDKKGLHKVNASLEAHRHDEMDEDDTTYVWKFFSHINILVGLTVMTIVGYKYSTYIQLLHENDMWFSNIKEVEREISFRTESGLYYSYYKQMVNAPSISEGLGQLMNDNLTEYRSVINVLARMNVYQEVLLAIVYRTFSVLQSNFEPVYFYIDVIFGLHGLLVCALYCTSWLLSGTWVAGLLTALLYIFNKVDTTRVEYVVPLRESFALPFLWGQLLFITVYLRPDCGKRKQMIAVAGTLVCTFCFAITWQFNQFVLLLQAMALFGVQVLELAPLHKIATLYAIQTVTMFGVFLSQFMNTMILTGLLPSFLIGAGLILIAQKKQYLAGDGVLVNAGRTLGSILLVFVLMISFNKLSKIVFPHQADEHIYKFVLSKLGFEQSRDFDVNLYLCNGAFTMLSWDTFERLTVRLAFPLYAVVHCLALLTLAVGILQKWRFGKVDKGEDEKQRVRRHWYQTRPELAYHIIQAVFFGVLAVSTLRMKYLWTPYMCILGSAGLSDQVVWSWLAGKIKKDTHIAVIWIGRHLLLCGVIGALLYVALPPTLSELEELREFHDPDTVQLMEWIKFETPKTAAFSGSMQLLAGVKLCTGRPITNHPHYEDKLLREKTFQIYQMYARQPAFYVYDTLKYHDTSYIILEDSICLAPSEGGCRLPDILDRANGHIPDKGKPEPGLVEAYSPRFCDEVRHAKGDYGKMFKQVFINKTFRIYKLMPTGPEAKPIIHPNSLPPVV